MTLALEILGGIAIYLVAMIALAKFLHYVERQYPRRPR